MYTVKEAAKQLGFTEHTIRFYTDKGLVPGVIRDKNNCRLFTEESINWLIGIKHLKECGMTLDAIKTYIELCLQGDSTIETRYHIILEQKEIAKHQLEEAQQRLETVYEQLANAKEEVGKPFPKEEELNQKLERLSELNALLNMDEREDAEAEVSESDEKEERPTRGSIHEKLQIYKEKSQRESETGKETRKRDFGLE